MTVHQNWGADGRGGRGLTSCGMQEAGCHFAIRGRGSTKDDTNNSLQVFECVVWAHEVVCVLCARPSCALVC
jgi:hypothetical protein